MQNLSILLLITSLWSTPSEAATGPKCTPTQKIGEICVCEISDLRPTQFSVGLFEVQRKQQKIKKHLGKGPQRLDKYIREKFEPVVLGPGNQMYITDHHHLARALWDEGIRTTYCKIELNLAASSHESFWAEMKKKKLVYLFDENGKGPLEPTALPKSIDKMKDDPYRSFAGRVREEGGYEKSNEPFSEFKWAEFFRTRLPKPKNEQEFLKAMPKALDLAKSDEGKAISSGAAESGSEPVKHD